MVYDVVGDSEISYTCPWLEVGAKLPGASVRDILAQTLYCLSDETLDSPPGTMGRARCLVCTACYPQYLALRVVRRSLVNLTNSQLTFGQITNPTHLKLLIHRQGTRGFYSSTSQPNQSRLCRR